MKKEEDRKVPAKTNERSPEAPEEGEEEPNVHGNFPVTAGPAVASRANSEFTHSADGSTELADRNDSVSMTGGNLTTTVRLYVDNTTSSQCPNCAATVRHFSFLHYF